MEALERCPFEELTVPTKTTLLEAGAVAQNFYTIKQGALRLWFNHDGKPITLQFFFEDQGVASLESFVRGTPSLFSIETIEPTTLRAYQKSDLLRLMDEEPALKEQFNQLIIGRLIHYTHLFLSRIKDTPQERYEALIQEHPEVVQRVAQHYIASYLGITPVSLSRLRARH